VNFEKGTGLLYGLLSDRRTRLHGDSRKNIARPLDLQARPLTMRGYSSRAYIYTRSEARLPPIPIFFEKFVEILSMCVRVVVGP